MGVKIIYEDSDILVLDKPAGVTVNRSDTTKGEETLQDWIEEELRFKNEDLRIDNDFYKRSGIVHRLDKETSGIILVGKTQEAFLDLQRQFKEREVEKKYVALVHGKVTPAQGEINVPVGRTPWNRKRFGIVAGGREAETRYRVISNFKLPITNEPLTLLELYPKTGRTHQIRVHLKYLGHPIFSDSLYGGRKITRADRKILKRHFLHASEIYFFHPKTKERLTFKSPLPKDLEELLASIEKSI